MQKIKKLLLLICIFMLVSSIATTATAESQTTNEFGLLYSGQNGVIFEINVPWESLVLRPTSTILEDYTLVELPSWEKTNQPGAPALPYLTKLIGVPHGVDLSLEIKTGKSHTINLTTPVLPVETQKIDWSLPQLIDQQTLLPEVSHYIESDSSIYNATNSYPGVFAQISNDGSLRGQRIASIAVYPIQFNPHTQTVTIVESLQLSVIFHGEMTSQSATTVSDSFIFEQAFDNVLLNYDEAKYWRHSTQELYLQDEIAPDLQINTLSELGLDWTPPAQAWRITTKQEGFYKLTKDVLDNAGFPIDTPTPELIQIFNQGTEIALEITKNTQDQVDSILFFAQSINTKYTDDNVFWLTIGDIGTRISASDGTPNAAETPGSYTAKLHMEEDHYYLTMAPGDDHLDRFLWDYLYPPSKPTWSYDFDLSAPVSGPAQITINLLGYINDTISPDHHVIVDLNGHLLADVWWDGVSWKSLQINIPEGILQSGSNKLELTCPNDTGVGIDLVYIDWVSLEFSNSFTATGNQLAFDYENSGTWQYRVKGFSNDDLVVYDVADPFKPVRITGVQVVAEGGQYSAIFEDQVSTQKSYVTSARSAFFVVSSTSIEMDNPSYFRSAANGADYIIITHSEFLIDPGFLSKAGDLMDLRVSQGLRTMMVDVQDIYDEFSFGVVSPYAIRDFLLYAYTNWAQPAPSFVLLLGDGHYDPKNNLGYGRNSYIPPFLMMADPLIGETAADNRYVTLVGNNNMPDMMLGRMSVNNPAEAQAFISKVLNYEHSPQPGEWQKQVLFVADQADHDAGDFPAMSENLLNLYLPDNFSADKVYLGDTHSTLAEARTAIQSSINSGKLLINYIGHGTYTRWSSGDGLLATGDIPSLTNGQKLPVVLAMTCREGYYHFPQPYSSNLEALGEVFTRADGKGAVASWSPSGAGVATGHSHLNNGFLGALFHNGALSIGEATIAGKLKLWGSGYNFDLMDTYLLFGDPAMRFVRGLTAVYDYYQTDENVALVVPVENGILANDINPGSATLTAQLVGSGTTNGDLVMNPDGSFTYTPNLDWYGNDSFTYQAFDGVEYSNSATVRIRVLKENNAPTDITLSNNTIYENYPIDTEIGTFSTLDPDAGDTFNYSLVVGEGSDDNNAFKIYRNKLRASIRFNYEEKNVYTIRVRTTDQWGAWFEKFFTIIILDLNDAPVAEDDYFVMEMNATLGLNENDLLSNDWDEDKDELSVYSVSNPIEGSVSLADGIITFNPSNDFTGQAGFTYTITDGNLLGQGHVYIMVNSSTNSAPVAEGQSVETTEDTPVQITLVATDADENPLTYSIVDEPANGILATDTLPLVTYTPNLGFHGSDSFTYKANDGQLDSNIAMVTITVIPSNQPPVVSGIPGQTIYKGQSFATINLDTYVSDPDNTANQITWTFSGNTQLGVSIDTNRVATITVPHADWIGSENITFRATDPGGLWSEDSATFTISEKPIIVVTVDAHSRVYGDEDPTEFTFTYTPDDPQINFTGALSRIAGEAVGLYPYTLNTLSAGDDYTIDLVTAYFSINPRPITITADNKTKRVDDPDPLFTYQITDGELVSTDQFSGSLSREEGEAVGFYEILQGTLSLSANYVLDFIPGTLTITDKPIITVTVDPGQTKVYGEDDPAEFTFTYTPEDPQINFTGALSRIAGEAVGLFAYKLNTLSAGDSYTIDLVTAYFSITPRPITVTADAISKGVEEPDPPLTFQITTGSLVNGDALSGSLERDPGESVGTYPIRKGSLSAGNNYNLSFINGVFTITGGSGFNIFLPLILK